MLEFISLVNKVVSFGVFTLLAYGCLVLAGLLFTGIGPAVIPKTAYRVVAIAALLVSAFSFGHLHGADDTAAKLAEKQARIEMLERQRSADKVIIAQANYRARQREEEAQALNEVLDEYQKGLENAPDQKCSDAGDASYRRGLRSILDRVYTSPSGSSAD